MTTAQEIQAATSLVPGAHRVLRALDPGEGPFRGALVSVGTGVAVLSDVEALSGWAGWSHAGCEHVAGPLDVVRRRDGHDVLLPRCTERVSAFLGRRAAAGDPLTRGETSTLVASALRGVVELGEITGIDQEGEWWLTDDGRPLFVIGEGQPAWRATAGLLERLEEVCDDRVLARILRSVGDGVRAADGRGRLPRVQCDRWETELLAVAAPRPLRRGSSSGDRGEDGVEGGSPLVRASSIAPAGGSGPLRSRDRSYGRGRSVRSRGRRRSDRRAHRQRQRARGRRRALRPVGMGSGPVGIGSRPGGKDSGPVGVDGLVEQRWSSSAVRAPRRPSLGAIVEALGRATGTAVDRGLRITRRVGSGSERSGASEDRPRPRRVPLVAGGVAAAVLVGGLLWPVEAEERAQGEGAAAGVSRTDGVSEGRGQGGQGASSWPPPDPEGASDPEDAPSADHGSPERGGVVPSAGALDREQEADPVSAAAELREMIASCALSGDAECGNAVAVGSSGLVERLGEAKGSVEFALVDAYGDIAVVRMTEGTTARGGSGTPTERMLVLVRREHEWLVRDVYDVADQPG